MHAIRIPAMPDVTNLIPCSSAAAGRGLRVIDTHHTAQYAGLPVTLESELQMRLGLNRLPRDPYFTDTHVVVYMRAYEPLRFTQTMIKRSLLTRDSLGVLSAVKPSVVDRELVTCLRVGTLRHNATHAEQCEHIGRYYAHPQYTLGSATDTLMTLIGVMADDVQPFAIRCRERFSPDEHIVVYWDGKIFSFLPFPDNLALPRLFQSHFYFTTL